MATTATTHRTSPLAVVVLRLQPTKTVDDSNSVREAKDIFEFRYFRDSVQCLVAAIHGQSPLRFFADCARQLIDAGDTATP